MFDLENYVAELESACRCLEETRAAFNKETCFIAGPSIDVDALARYVEEIGKALDNLGDTLDAFRIEIPCNDERSNI